MLPETGAQLCVFCGEGSGESVSVGDICFSVFFILSSKMHPIIPIMLSLTAVTLSELYQVGGSSGQMHFASAGRE